MADSDKAEKKAATRPTVRGAAAPGASRPAPAAAADETAVRPAVGAQPTARAAAKKASAPAPAAKKAAAPSGAAAKKAAAPSGAATKAVPGSATSAAAAESPAEETVVSRAALVGDEPQGMVASDDSHPLRRPRRARLRLTRIDPLSVMKSSFLLSVAFGVVTFVAVLITWSVLGAAGVWDSVNDTVGTIVSSGENDSTFDIRDYVGMGRVLGFTLIVAVVDVILLTAIATLTAFLYNMAASLLGGIEVTLSEDDH